LLRLHGGGGGGAHSGLIFVTFELSNAKPTYSAQLYRKRLLIKTFKRFAAP